MLSFRLDSLFALLLIGSALPGYLSAQQPVLNEFLASNDTGLQDEDGDRSDWIEIYNPSTSPLNLGGWRLTDEAADLSKWVLPPQTLAAGEYAVVFASNKDRATAGQPLHTNFRLSASGEYLALVSPARHHHAVLACVSRPGARHRLRATGRPDHLRLPGSSDPRRAQPRWRGCAPRPGRVHA